MVQPFQNYLFRNRGTFNHKLLRQDGDGCSYAIMMGTIFHAGAAVSVPCSAYLVTASVPRLREFHSTFGFIYLIGDPPRATGRSKVTHSVLSED